MSFTTTLKHALNSASLSAIENVDVVSFTDGILNDSLVIQAADKTFIVALDQEIEIDENGWATVRTTHGRNHAMSFHVSVPLTA